MLDTFTGSDVSPAPGWTALSGLQAMQRVGNVLKGGGTTWSGSYYNVSSFAVPFEVYFDVILGFTGGGVQEMNYLTKDAGGGEPADANRNGYRIYFSLPSDTQLEVREYAAGVEGATLLTGTWTTVNTDTFWVKVDSANLHSIYAKHTADPDFTLLGSFTDATYTDGRVTLNTDGNGTAEYDNFGGGALVEGPGKQTIYVSRRRMVQR